MAEADPITHGTAGRLSDRLGRIEEALAKLTDKVDQLATARAVGEPMTATLQARVSDHGKALDDMSEWRAEVRGSLKLVAWLAGGAGTVLFAAICGLAGAIFSDHDRNTRQETRIEELEADRNALRNDVTSLRALLQRGP